MLDPLLELVGANVASVDTLFGYIQIGFGNVGLTIYNGIAMDNIASIEELLERRLCSVLTEARRITFRFSGGATLRLDMSNDAFICPEAMVLTRPDQPTVV
jgi:hypothetical protein